MEEVGDGFQLRLKRKGRDMKLEAAVEGCGDCPHITWPCHW